MKYFVGIDGGGSKTDFVVSNSALQVVHTVHIPKGANPWQNGLEATLEVLEEGLSQLTEYRADTEAIVAGIGGCFSVNKFTSAIENCLKQFCLRAQLVGDLPIAFRAASDHSSGIIAIAGTGSSAVQFFSDGSHYLYDAVGCGGRDIGYWLAKAYGRDQLGEAGKDFLLQVAPVLQRNELHTTADFYHNAELRMLTKSLAVLDAKEPAFEDLKFVLDLAADRWRFKLYGIVTKFLLKEPDTSQLCLVLSGGLWKHDYFRNQVTIALQAEFTQLDILFNPEVAPTLGALRMARDLSNK